MTIRRRLLHRDGDHQHQGNHVIKDTTGSVQEGESDESAESEEETVEETEEENPKEDPTLLSHPSAVSYHVTRWAILQLLGFVYWVAFISAWNQNMGLLGSQGLLPAAPHWHKLQARQGFLQHPSLFWWIPMTDTTLEGVAILGVIVSTLILTGLYVSWASFLLLWLLQFSLITTAQHTPFYQYGWESQLLETGFLAIFLCPLPHIQIQKWRLKMDWALTSSTITTHPPSPIILYLFRWLSFRISMGAGLIKIRGSSCWTQKTCLHYHFETQPIPSPLSFIFHFLPKSMLEQAVDLDLFVQLYTSWMVLIVPLPLFGNNIRQLLRNMLRLAGCIQAGFMVNIMLSGNFSFLNHLTIVPALACLDDACWPTTITKWVAVEPKLEMERKPPTTTSGTWSFPPRWFVDTALFLLIAYLSQPVIHNLLPSHSGQGRRQVMNASFDRFRLVNTYGAFGDVGRQRFEPIVLVSTNGMEWHELEFPCKPGTVTRRPCFCAPYHYRIDWNIWFLGFPPHSTMLQQREQWLYHLLQKLLDPLMMQNNVNNNPTTTILHHQHPPWWDLLDSTTVRYLQQLQKPLRYAKVDMYHYQMSAPLVDILQQYYERMAGTSSSDDAVYWWKRTYHEPLIDPVKWDPKQHNLVWAKNNL